MQVSSPPGRGKWVAAAGEAQAHEWCHQPLMSLPRSPWAARMPRRWLVSQNCHINAGNSIRLPVYPHKCLWPVDLFACYLCITCATHADGRITGRLSAQGTYQRSATPERETRMTISPRNQSRYKPQDLPDPRTSLPHAAPAGPGDPSGGSQGSPEGEFLGGPGKSVYRHVGDLQGQTAEAKATAGERRHAKERAEDADRKHKENHRGGDRPWLLRGLIPPGLAAEAVTAFVAMEALVGTLILAEGLSALTALLAGLTACIIANRRLNRLPIPRTLRALEGAIVVVLTVLRYESMRIQGAGLLTAVGAAALAALISGLVLFGIEEIVVETRTFPMFLSSVRVSWNRWRHAAAASRLSRTQARLEVAAEKLRQHFLDFLLKIRGFPLDEARRRATALKMALTEDEG